MTAEQRLKEIEQLVGNALNHALLSSPTSTYASSVRVILNDIIEILNKHKVRCK